MKKVVYTAVFTLFGFIFFSSAHYLISLYFPDFNWFPSTVDRRFFIELLGLFTLGVAISFLGANYIVYGNASGKEKEGEEADGNR